MRGLVKNIVSPKLMVAIMTAASFVIVPAISQAGEKGQQKKPEMMMKKDAKKAEHKAHKAEMEEQHKAHKEEHKAHKEEHKVHKKEMKEVMDD